MPKLSGDHPKSSAGRREERVNKEDSAGLPHDLHAEAMAAASDVIGLSDDQSTAAMAAHLKILARDQPDVADSARSRGTAKPLSPEMKDWMRRFQEGGVKMANDEEARKAIAKRLF